MPPLATRFGAAVDDAIALSSTAEAVRSDPSYVRIKSKLTMVRIETLYEVSFLRIFASWEAFIEDSLLHMLCGFESALYRPTFKTGYVQAKSLAAARSMLFGARAFMLWYDPATIRRHSSRFLVGSPQDSVAASSSSRLEWFAFVRNRIAHDSADAQRKFDTASINLAGRRFPRSRPGKFLRFEDPKAHISFLDSIASELKALAAQIAP